jgi:hypothetical protein
MLMRWLLGWLVFRQIPDGQYASQVDGPRLPSNVGEARQKYVENWATQEKKYVSGGARRP